MIRNVECIIILHICFKCLLSKKRFEVCYSEWMKEIQSALSVWEFENLGVPKECQTWQFSPGLSHCPTSKDYDTQRVHSCAVITSLNLTRVISYAQKIIFKKYHSWVFRLCKLSLRNELCVETTDIKGHTMKGIYFIKESAVSNSVLALSYPWSHLAS